MNKLNGLIQELCPDGVEYKKVKEAFQRLRGTPITAGKMKEIEDPTGEIKIFAGGKTIINAKEENIPNANITRVPAVLVQSRGVIDVVYYDKPFTFKNEMWAYTADNEIKVKYLYYVLKNNIQGFRDAASGMGSLPQISLPVTEDFRIPLPPLPVQREIVRILDNFTELTAELNKKLEEELAARRKQYEHYRDELLTFGDGIERKFIGDVCVLSAGGDVPKGKFSKEKTEKYSVPIFSNGIGANALYGFTDIAKIKAPCVTVAARGTIGYCELRNEDFFPVVRLICACPKQDVLAAYLKYYLETIRFQVPTSGIPQLTVPMLAKYLIPVPSIAKQEQIVSILDRFDALCNDLTSGLPAEIAARQKQYEYYRDRLLTFKEWDA